MGTGRTERDGRTVQPGSRPGDGRERGSGTVLGLALVVVLVILTVAVVGLARAVHARGTAQSAADLAALAAASALHRAGGSIDDPCTVAAHVVEANDAEPAGCTVSGAVVEVRARVVVLGQSDGVLVARANARAGPAR
ncbi:histidine kinase [Georgenia yuyongxinii]|uniref:Histidine kinase n=1 Tax=Georgenia yuyongxinii TaxID=2589797 RepID=A0A5B8CAJ5_9MICO|nr:Rv3654c family TadE-like protein [Georgenia yuyongxinii]QDC26465.1 histidine kinase [Georgenia yuyongxinii]